MTPPLVAEQRGFGGLERLASGPGEGAAYLARAERLLQLRDLTGALAAFDLAESAGAETDRCAAGRWLAHMLAGNFAAAWRESDAIRGRGAEDPHRFWDGRDICGQRVIVRCLHGYGDAVQFLRYAPRLRARAAQVIVEAPPRLVELARCLRGVDDVITWGDGAPAVAPEWDVQVEVMELPYLFRTDVAELPLAANYLELPPEVKGRVAESMGSAARPRVGVVWAAGQWNHSRSIPFAAMARLPDGVECEVWSLQGGAEGVGRAGRDEWKLRPHGWRDADECGEGILTLAAVISDLDLVITVDTLAAHLAGALGRPAWVLLQHAADWRWMTERDDSPWYPSLRLFRQSAAGDWDGLADRVHDELVKWAKA